LSHSLRAGRRQFLRWFPVQHLLAIKPPQTWFERQQPKPCPCQPTQLWRSSRHGDCWHLVHRSKRRNSWLAHSELLIRRNDWKHGSS